MSEVGTIGLDIAKHVFQAHGVDASGHVLLRKDQPCETVAFLAAQPRCRRAIRTMQAHRRERPRTIASLPFSLSSIVPLTPSRQRRNTPVRHAQKWHRDEAAFMADTGSLADRLLLGRSLR